MPPFRLSVPDERVEEMRRRVAATRWPDPLPDTGWDRGVPARYLHGLAEYWVDGFDWSEVETRANRWSQVRLELDGTTVHALHVRSPEPDARPLLITHGWPGSFLDFLDVLGPLSDPRAHGGDPRDAFHVIVPSLPGFGFSTPLREHGWTMPRVAELWLRLMSELGYERFITQGGDLGAAISGLVGVLAPERVAGAHLNFLFAAPAPGDDLSGLTATDADRLGRLARFVDDGSAYMAVQGTRPQTIGFALEDSPVGLLAWMVEKYQEWTDADKDPEDVIGRDKILADVSLYWLTATATSAAHFYRDNAAFLPIGTTPPPAPPRIPVPVGVAVFPGDLAPPVRRFAERDIPQLVHWSEMDRGGHFPTLEVPGDYVRDVRAFARRVS